MFHPILSKDGGTRESAIYGKSSAILIEASNNYEILSGNDINLKLYQLLSYD